MNLKKLFDELPGNCSFNESVDSVILHNIKRSWYLSNLREAPCEKCNDADRNSNKAYGSRDLDDKNDSKVISAAPVTVLTNRTASLRDNIDNERTNIKIYGMVQA